MGRTYGVCARTDFDAGPFAPEIDAGGGFDGVGDVGAADAGGDFDEVEFSVFVSAQKFGVRDAANQAQGGDQLAIHFLERFGFGGSCATSVRVVKTPPSWETLSGGEP